MKHEFSCRLFYIQLQLQHNLVYKKILNIKINILNLKYPFKTIWNLQLQCSISFINNL